MKFIPGRRETIQELISRVARLTGPDREVDRQIFFLLSGWCVPNTGQIIPFFDPPRAVPVEKYPYLLADSLSPTDGTLCDPYTASVDAALALCERVLPGPYHITLVLDPSGCGCDWRSQHERARFFGFASRELPASMTS